MHENTTMTSAMLYVTPEYITGDWENYEHTKPQKKKSTFWGTLCLIVLAVALIAILI